MASRGSLSDTSQHYFYHPHAKVIFSVLYVCLSALFPYHMDIWWSPQDLFKFDYLRIPLDLFKLVHFSTKTYYLLASRWMAFFWKAFFLSMFMLALAATSYLKQSLVLLQFDQLLLSTAGGVPSEYMWSVQPFLPLPGHPARSIRAPEQRPKAGTRLGWVPHYIDKNVTEDKNSITAVF